MFDIDKIYVVLKEFGIKKGKNSTTFTEKTDTGTVGGRNNRIFDLQYSVLTNADTTTKMFNPGSFDVQKKTARIVSILKNSDKYTYDLLRGMSLDLLTDLNDSVSGRDITLSSTQVYFHKLNMTAGKLIGIFANNNTSHAFLSMQDISLRLEEGFTFDGVEVNNVLNNKLDSLYAKDGSLISKNIASFLAASVDAVKDPVLNFMNLNTFTTGTAMVLTRLGFDVDSVGLFLTQPIIELVTREYMKLSNEGFVLADSFLGDLINLLADQLGLNPEELKKDISTIQFTKEDMAKNLINPSDSFLLDALILFLKLAKIAQDLGTLTFLTKFNSVTNAVGPTIADTLVLRERYNKFIDKMNGDNAPFNLAAISVILNSPILDAFYTTTVADGGASLRIFEDFFPHYGDRFTDVLNLVRQTTKGALDAKTINKLANDFVLYKLTAGEDPILGTNYEERNYYINGFLNDFKKLAGEILDNDLIKIIQTEPRNEKVPVPTLNARTGGYGVDVQELVKNGWSNLISNPSTNSLAILLFYYNLFRSGFSFSPKTFMHLASTDVKLGVDGYVEAIRDIEYMDDFISVPDFIMLFRRNHTELNKIVPKFDGGRATVKEKKGSDGDTRVLFSFGKNKSWVRPIIVAESNNAIEFAPLINYNGRILALSAPYEDVVIYRETTTLGNPNNFLEYNANEGSLTIKSALIKPTVTEAEVETEETTTDEVDTQEGVNTNDYGEITEADREFLIKRVFTEAELDEAGFASTESEAKLVFVTFVNKHLNDKSLSESVLNRVREIAKKLC